MPPSPIALLLDIDGTLLDTVPFILDSVRAAFAGREDRPTDDAWIAGIGTPLRHQLVPFTRGPDDLEAVMDRYRAYQRDRIATETRAFEGALEVVRLLHGRGHPVAVVTGKLEETARRSLEVTGFLPYVDALVGGDSCAEHKPHPGPVLHALGQLGRRADEAIFVGDSPLDVLAGNAAGVVTVAALYGAATREALLAAGPNHLLEAVGDLPALVDRLEARRAPSRSA